MVLSFSLQPSSTPIRRPLICHLLCPLSPPTRIARRCSNSGTLIWRRTWSPSSNRRRLGEWSALMVINMLRGVWVLLNRSKPHLLLNPRLNQIMLPSFCSGFAPLELYDGVDLQYRTTETLNNDLHERTCIIFCVGRLILSEVKSLSTPCVQSLSLVFQSVRASLVQKHSYTISDYPLNRSSYPCACLVLVLSVWLCVPQRVKWIPLTLSSPTALWASSPGSPPSACPHPIPTTTQCSRVCSWA